MIRADRGGSAAPLLLACCLVCLAGCKAEQAPRNGAPSVSRSGGAGGGGAGSGGKGGNGGISAPGAGGTGAGGASGSGSGSGGTGSGGGPAAGNGGTGTGGAGGSGGAGPGMDAPAAADSSPAGDGAGTDLFAEGDYLPNRPDLRICKKEWTAEQCCAFLCRCLSSICSDSPKGRPGIATCGTWCPKLGDMARRCHVYHCFVSISPTGGIKDHDSHCGHAADQVAGGGCPVEVYQK
jgi:hypothetical protein